MAIKSDFSFKKAQWIWIPEKKINQYVEFYKEFEYSGGKALFYISSKTDYVLYINGKFVNCGQYGDFPELKSVDVIDGSDYLNIGLNKIKILARSLNEGTFSVIKSGYGVIFEICDEGKILCSSDSKVLARESIEYVSGQTYSITPQISYGYNANVNTENTKKFKNAEVINDSASFFLRPIEKLQFSPIENSEIIAKGNYILSEGKDISEKYQKAFLSFEEIKEVDTIQKTAGDGVYFIVDLKRETSGFLTFDLELDSDADVVVTYGEHLKDLRVRNLIFNRNFILFHKCKQGNNSFTSYLRRIGCRYLQFFVSCDKVKINKATVIETLYPIQVRNIKIKDYLLNKIWGTSLNTLRQCMHEHYEDCPWREQAQYGTDSFLQILSGFYAFTDQKFAKKALNLMGHELNDKGLLCLTSPCRQELFIPSFSISYINAVCGLYNWTKDKTILEESAVTVEKILNTFISNIDKTGLVKRFDAWNFYEWTDGLCYYEEPSYHAPINAMLYGALNRWCKVAKLFLTKDKFNNYNNVKKSIRLAFDKTFWNEEKGAYATYLTNNELFHYAEYTQAIILWSGLSNGKKANRLCEILKSDNDLVKISLSSNYFKYDGLIKHDKRNLNFVIEDIKDRWGKMLFDGATSFYETELGEKDFDNAGSLCHGWSALPIYIMGKYVLKIKN